MERPDDNDSQYWFNPSNRRDGIIECAFDHVNYERHLNTFCDYQAQQIKELKKYTQHSRRCGLDKFGLVITKVGTRTWDCTCGLDKALKN